MVFTRTTIRCYFKFSFYRGQFSRSRLGELFSISLFGWLDLIRLLWYVISFRLLVIHLLLMLFVDIICVYACIIASKLMHGNWRHMQRIFSTNCDNIIVLFWHFCSTKMKTHWRLYWQFVRCLIFFGSRYTFSEVCCQTLLSSYLIWSYMFWWHRVDWVMAIYSKRRGKRSLTIQLFLWKLSARKRYLAIFFWCVRMAVLYWETFRTMINFV